MSNRGPWHCICIILWHYLLTPFQCTHHNAISYSVLRCKCVHSVYVSRPKTHLAQHSVFFCTSIICSLHICKEPFSSLSLLPIPTLTLSDIIVEVCNNLIWDEQHLTHLSHLPFFSCWFQSVVHLKEQFTHKPKFCYCLLTLMTFFCGSQKNYV